jgi:sulfur-oxidizing protein SoxY
MQRRTSKQAVLPPYPVVFYQIKKWHESCNPDVIQEDFTITRILFMQNTRRLFLKGTMAASTLAVAAGANLLTPGQVLAAWPEKAFNAKKMDAALTELEGSTQLVDSDKITVKTPDIAENGAVVSVTVSTQLPDAESISIYVPVNAFPLTASYELTDQIDGSITGRIKMAKTSDVIAVVKAGGKLYTAKKPVKVTLGGCGG